MARVVLVTGISRYLGGRLAHLLQADETIDRVIGVDVIPPEADIGRAEFVRADIRNPVISKIINAANVDTVVHMNVIATPIGGSSRSSMKEINVIGSMQLLAACQRAPSLKQLVVKSSTRVYGVSPKDPALFTEDMEPNRLPRAGFPKDSVEVESYVRGFARRRPDVAISLLRLANILGPRIDTRLTRYFSLPVVPTVLGFDGRMQFCHEEDALHSLLRCAIGQHPGTFNIAGDGFMLLSQAIARAGRVNVPMPAPLASLTRNAVRRFGLIDSSAEQIDFLKYGRGVDTTRAKNVLGFTPAYTTEQTFEEFVRSRHLGRVIPNEVLEDVEAKVMSFARYSGSANE